MSGTNSSDLKNHPSLREKLGVAPHSKQSLRLWLRLLSTTMVIEKTIRARLAKRFATTLPRFDILSALARKGDGLLMKELSASLMVSNGNVTGVVERLIQDGLVERVAVREDRRHVRVTLTRKGKRHFEIMAAEHEKWIEELFAKLSEQEIDALMAMLLNARKSIVDVA